jgi:HEAT repeat protein
MRYGLFAALLLGTSMLAMAQQPPRVVNAQLHTEPAGGALPAALSRLQQARGPLWAGYEVAAVAGPRFSQCPDDAKAPADEECCGVYRLEGDHVSRQSTQGPAVQTSLAVLVRIDQSRVNEIRFAGARCPLDAGGLSFTWLTGVDAQDSIAWLSSLATADNGRVTEQALAAMAMHATPRAAAALSGIASASNPAGLREKAAFWLGTARGHEGLLALQQLIRDADPAFRTKLSFDLYLNSDPAAVEDLIRMARSDADAQVREQAIFWVAQKAGAKAAATLQEVVADDPETAVKQKAVFALSLLPRDEAVSQLLRVAQTSQSRAVRTQALFWLGQTHDPRALAYFEKILEH